MIGLKLVMEAGKCTFNCLSIPREIAQHDRSNGASIPAELSTLAAVVEHCGKM